MAHHIIESLCDGCSACFGQCPTAAIIGVFQRSFRIEEPLCIDCGVCGFICPVDAVLDQHGRVVPRIPRHLRPRPIVNWMSCTGCNMCVDICAFDCRILVGTPYDSVSMLAAPHRCVACGECATVCSKGAIAMKPFDLTAYDPENEAARIRERLSESDTAPSPHGARDEPTKQKVRK